MTIVNAEINPKLNESDDMDLDAVNKELRLDSLFDDAQVIHFDSTDLKKCGPEDQKLEKMEDIETVDNELTANSNNVNTNIQVNKLKFEERDFLSQMNIFYKKIFPFKLFYRWLSYGNVSKTYFSLREFSFTLPNDAYLRFHSYQSEQELKQDILKLNPVKIDVGAVYNTQPKNKKMLREGVFKPVERELVFDIDMTDYDEIRTCCSGGSICLKCWKFMTISIKVIDRVLREDFGFKHLLWVYSGRRGVHCWVCDERARKLSSEARKGIVGYLEVVKGGEGKGKKLNLHNKLHPSLIQAKQILDQHFLNDIIIGLKVLDQPEEFNKVLNLIPDEEIKKKLTQHWNQNRTFTSEEKWENILGEVQHNRKPHLKNCVRDIIFQYSYPRLDDNVSTGLNHLLKAPFCIHPKTGSVCVPIDPNFVDSFNPFNVPTLNLLLEEIENGISVEMGSLNGYLVYFHTFLEAIETELAEVVRRQNILEDKKMLF